MILFEWAPIANGEIKKRERREGERNIVDGKGRKRREKEREARCNMGVAYKALHPRSRVEITTHGPASSAF